MLSPTTLDTNAVSLQTVLATFTWGTTPTIARYNSGNTDISVGNVTFSSEPTLALTIDAPFNGGTEDAPVNITMDMRKTPFDRLCLPYPHTKVLVVIEKCDPRDVAGTRYEIFSGRISRVTVKPTGRQGLAKAKIVGVKARLNATLGLPCTSSCLWKFGDENQSLCGVTLSDKRIVGTVASLYDSGIPNSLTLTFSGSPDLDNTRWSRGYMELDGLTIGIRQSLNDSTGRFELTMSPPPYWLGGNITLTPGCDKSLARCQYWNNVARFTALGYAMPDRNPVFEE